MTDSALLKRIESRCGPLAIVAPADTAQRILNPLRPEAMRAVPLLRPADTAEVAFIVQATRDSGRALIPVGGTSGLAGGLKSATGQEWYLSLERMRRIETIDATSRLAVVQAGVVLQTLHEAAAEVGLLFPVDLGGRGLATVGGLIATNAGGERVLRFGMMREQVLGLEVVLADGTVLDLMDRVLKNNAGYDLKPLFIGTEGTLGIVTRAVLRLRPAFAGHDAALLALNAIADVPQVLAQLERALGGTLSAFELMWPEFIASMMVGEDSPHRLPVAADAPGYILVEAEGGDPDGDRERFVAALGHLLEDGLLADAAVAKNEAERKALWAIRNDIPRLGRSWAPSISFDVSVPIAQMADYVAETRAALVRGWPQSRLLAFGHVADNNLHLTVNAGPGIEVTPQLRTDVGQCIYAGVLARRGSISAEHGIGLDKRAALAAARPPEVMALMRGMKAWLDPQGLLNPGKVV